MGRKVMSDNARLGVIFGTTILACVVGFGGAHLAYSSNPSIKQGLALSEAFNKEMTGEKAVSYLSSHGFTNAQAARFEACAKEHDDKAGLEKSGAVRRCMMIR